jgi:large subunit ribosomal protein L24
MKSRFSKSWKASVKPRKQRKYLFNAPFHIKRRMLNALLSDGLKKKYGMRSLEVRKGDKVKIMRGEFKKNEGVVERVDVKYSKVFVQNISRQKRDGTKIAVSIHPSKLMIVEVKEEKNRVKAEVKKEKMEGKNGKESS